VNRTFKEHSSPFLLPCVVFARRLDVITKLRQVLQHPYFRQFVQELVYDGSSYSEATATDWEQYVEDCDHAPRDLEDAAWLERESRNRVAWLALDSFRTRNSTMHIPSDESMELGKEEGGIVLTRLRRRC